MAKWNWLSLIGFNKPNIDQMKTQGDIEGLVQVLKHKDYNVRNRANEALIALGSLAIEPLIASLKDKAVYRHYPLSILAASKDPRAVEAMCAALIDEEPEMQLASMGAVEKLADASFVGPLIRAAKHPKATVNVQTLLRSLLYKSADQVSEDVLREAVALNDSYVLIFVQIEGSCTFTEYSVSNEEADFSYIKQLARQELIRRGMDA